MCDGVNNEFSQVNIFVGWAGGAGVGLAQTSTYPIGRDEKEKRWRKTAIAPRGNVVSMAVPAPIRSRGMQHSYYR